MFVTPQPSTQALIAAHFPQAGIVQLQETGLIGILPHDVPSQEIPPLIDALLAAPVLVTVVTYAGDGSLDLVTELRDQAADLMLVGVDLSGIATEAAVTTALTDAQAAGAQFIILPLRHAPLCLQMGLPHIPFVTTLTEAAAAVQLGYQLLYGQLSPAILAEWRAQIPTLNLIAAHTATPAQIPVYLTHQATAVAVPLWHDPAQTMRQVITKARRLSAAWQKHYPFKVPNYE